MDMLLILQLVGAALGLALIAITATGDGSPYRKWGAVALGVLLIASLYGADASLLGRPKPARLEPGEIDARMVAVHMVEGKAIYLWLLETPDSPPVSLVLPWDQKTARAAREAQREADGRGTGVRVRLGERQTASDDEPLFHAEPQPTLPPKAEEQG